MRQGLRCEYKQQEMRRSVHFHSFSRKISSPIVAISFMCLSGVWVVMGSFAALVEDCVPVLVVTVHAAMRVKVSVWVLCVDHSWMSWCG